MVSWSDGKMLTGSLNVLLMGLWPLRWDLKDLGGREGCKSTCNQQVADRGCGNLVRFRFHFQTTSKLICPQSMASDRVLRLPNAILRRYAVK
jgi:hypothetical protein